MRISVDTGRCVGAGQCVLNQPELFDQDDDGLVVALVTEPDPDQAAAAREAASLCPAHAITLAD